MLLCRDVMALTRSGQKIKYSKTLSNQTNKTKLLHVYKTIACVPTNKNPTLPASVINIGYNVLPPSIIQVQSWDVLTIF